jgi:hypothetical protein
MSKVIDMPFESDSNQPVRKPMIDEVLNAKVRLAVAEMRAKKAQEIADKNSVEKFLIEMNVATYGNEVVDFKTAAAAVKSLDAVWSYLDRQWGAVRAGRVELMGLLGSRKADDGVLFWTLTGGDTAPTPATMTHEAAMKLMGFVTDADTLRSPKSIESP